ncbi:MAG: nucleotidyltransferase family protein [Leptospira sp.]|nr:nucleotidyltransferase family protein [Leptospira sp.]
MSKLEVWKNNIQRIKPNLIQNYHVNSIGIFGSFARGEENDNSDLDILVDFSEPIDLFQFLELEEKLEEVCQVKVDLISKNALKPNIGKQILKEIQYL